jgi:hypothetical protein
LLRRLGSACFVMRRLYYILNTDSLKLVYCAHFHTVIKYGKIFWGYQHNVNKMFILPKRILTIMRGWGYRSSSRAWFKQLEIWTVPYLYIYSLVMYVICNSCYLKQIFVYIQYTLGRKIMYINHWLNLHRYKVELLILPLRYLINCHQTLLNFSMTKCSSRTEKVFTLLFFILLMNFYNFTNVSLFVFLLNNCA